MAGNAPDPASANVAAAVPTASSIGADTSHSIVVVAPSSATAAAVALPVVLSRKVIVALSSFSMVIVLTSIEVIAANSAGVNAAPASSRFCKFTVND